MDNSMIYYDFNSNFYYYFALLITSLEFTTIFPTS